MKSKKGTVAGMQQSPFSCNRKFRQNFLLHEKAPQGLKSRFGKNTTEIRILLL